MPITQGRVHALFDNTVRKTRPTADPAYSFLEKDGIWRLVGPTPDPGDNTIVFARLDPQDPEGAIESVIAEFRELGHGLEWKVYGYDRPPNLGALLLEHGLEQAGTETLMVIDPRDSLPAKGRPVLPCRRAEDEASILSVADVHDGEAGTRLAHALLDEHRAGPTTLSVWIVQTMGRTIAAAWTRFDITGKVAGFWGGTVRPEWRGNGLYSALVATRMDEARKRGTELVYVEARETSRGMLLRWGFKELTRIRSFVLQPPPPY